MLPLLVLTTLAALPTASRLPNDDPLARYAYPLAPYVPGPPVIVDASAAPEAAAWARTAAGIMRAWYPTVRSLLATSGAPVPKALRLTIKPNIGPPAYCAGNEITVKAEWVRDHPDDLGIVIHEMTHAVQSYPDFDAKPGWLVEGIADYIRWWRYEPEPPHSKIDPEKANYTDAYRTTAYWLAWTSKQYDMRLVPSLDAEMRAGRDPMPIFLKLTGKEPAELWKEFLATKP